MYILGSGLSKRLSIGSIYEDSGIEKHKMLISDLSQVISQHHSGSTELGLQNCVCCNLGTTNLQAWSLMALDCPQQATCKRNLKSGHREIIRIKHDGDDLGQEIGQNNCPENNMHVGKQTPCQKAQLNKTKELRALDAINFVLGPWFDCKDSHCWGEQKAPKIGKQRVLLSKQGIRYRHYVAIRKESRCLTLHSSQNCQSIVDINFTLLIPHVSVLRILTPRKAILQKQRNA